MINLDTRVMKAAKNFLTNKGFEIKDVLPDNAFVNLVALDDEDNVHAIRVAYSFTGLNDNSNISDFRDVAEREFFGWLASNSGECDFFGRIIFDCIDLAVVCENQALLRFHNNVLC